MKFVFAIEAQTFNGKAVAAKEFLWGGEDAGLSYDPVTQNVAILDRHPDFRTERCDDSKPVDVDREVHKRMAIRPATQQEMETQAAAKKDEDSISALEAKAIKAGMLVTKGYCNALKDEVRGLAVLLVQKGVISAQDANGLLSYDGSGVGDKKTDADLQADYAAEWKRLS